MNILLSNDDGYLAPGLTALYDALENLGAITVVAPEQNHSGASNSLTLTHPLRPTQVAENRYAVNGTPADCVHMALTGLLDVVPDMVVSGINAGANLGDDTLYSGTVAAAIEGRHLGLPTIAVSLAGRKEQNYAAAGKIVANILTRMQQKPIAADTILNINVPDLPYEQIKGVLATRLGRRHPSEPMIEAKDPHDRAVYWIGPAGKSDDGGDGTDFGAIRAGYASITPLQIDMTRHAQVSQLAQWLDN